MRTAALGELAEFVNGAAFKPEDWHEAGLPIIRIQNLTDPSRPFNRTRRKVPERLHVLPGDLLVSWSATLGVFEWPAGGGEAVLNQHIFRVLHRADFVDKRYLMYVLHRALSDMGRHLHGATMKHVNRTEFLGTEVPLPSVGEQRRIAAVLDQADELRAKRHACLVLLDTLSEAIFLDMFGDPAADAHLPLVPLADVCDIQIGYPFKSELYTPHQDGVRLCRGANVLPGRLDWSDLRRYPTELASEFDAYRLSVGDVIIAMDRPWIKEGFKVALTTEYDAGALLVQRVARLRANEAVSSSYLYALLRRPSFVSHCRPTETTIPHISPREIRDYSFAAPNPKLLRRFDEAVSHTAPLVSIAGAAAAETEVLFDSLQQRAFAGQL